MKKFYCNDCDEEVVLKDGKCPICGKNWQKIIDDSIKKEEIEIVEESEEETSTKKGEKELGRTYAKKIGSLIGCLTVLGLLLSLIIIGAYFGDKDFQEDLDYAVDRCETYDSETYCEEAKEMRRPLRIGIYTLVGTVVISMLVYKAFSKIVIVVTDKRVYGKAIFGRRIDIPLDSVSSVSKGLFDSIRVASSSGSISFALLENRDGVYEVISDLLLARQDNNRKVEKQPKQIKKEEQKEETPVDDIELIRKYKQLLDDGVITEDEFNKKKKQIMKI